MGDFNITINGKTVPVNKGQTVLQASLAAGIDIPVFCWHPQLVPVGACRICLVEIEKFPKLQVACATPATENMVVQTNSPKVVKARQGVLEFILANHPLDCPTCDKGGECDLQNITFKYGLDYSRMAERKHRFVVDEKSTFDDLQIGPEIIRNQNRCIHCYRCTRIVDEAAFEDDLGAYQRGYHTEILPPPDREIRNLYSGNVVEYCPVGALTNDDWRYKVRVWLTQKAASVCPHCPDGCNTTVWTYHNRVFRSSARANDNIDRGFLCDVGRYGYQFVNSADRLKLPMIKRNGQLVEATWEDALSFIKQRVGELKSKHAGSAFFGLIGATSTNEEIYAFQRLMRRVIGTSHIDHRLERKRKLTFGEEVTSRNITPDPVTYQDIDNADVYVVYSSDLHTENPITALRVKRGVRYRDAKIITINPRPTHLEVRTGATSLIFKPGTGVVALQALVSAVVSGADFNKSARGLTDQHLSEFRQNSQDMIGAKAATITGISEDSVESAAAILKKAKNVVIFCGADFNRYPFRDDELLAIDNLRRVCPSAKLALMPAYSNSIGAELLGARPDRYPGTSSADAKTKLETLWKGTIPEANGKDTVGILQSIADDEIEGGIIFNSDPVRSFPDGQYAADTLEKLKFLIVIDTFMTDTANLADVVLPLATFAENDGTRTNWEGRIQVTRSGIKPQHAAKTGCEAIELIAEKLGISFGQTKPIEVYAEMSKTLGFEMPARYEMFKSEGVLATRQRPEPKPGLNKVTYNAMPPDPNYPFTMLVANADHHRGVETERNPSLRKFADEPYVGLNPKDADLLKLANGDLAKVESQAGKVVGKVRVFGEVPEKTVLLPENFREMRVNSLMSLKEKLDLVKVTKM